MRNSQRTIHIVFKALAALLLIFLARSAEEVLALWPGPRRLTLWIFFAALLQVAFHQPFSAQGKNRFIFTTPLVVFGGVCVIATSLLEGILHKVIVSPPISFCGDLLFLSGLALRTAAQQALGELFHWNIRVVQGHRLVTTGIFKHIRHPSYLGVMLMGLAAPLIANAYWAFLSFPILLSCFLVRIHYEEQALREAMPEYGEYASRTARLIPGIY